MASPDLTSFSLPILQGRLALVLSLERMRSDLLCMAMESAGTSFAVHGGPSLGLSLAKLKAGVVAVTAVHGAGGGQAGQADSLPIL